MLLLLLLRVLYVLVHEALHVLATVSRGGAPTLPLTLRCEILALPSPSRLRPQGDPARRIGLAWQWLAQSVQPPAGMSHTKQ